MYFLGYLTIISLISVTVCCYDKFAAAKGNWRISEKTLFLLSILGGSIAMFTTMKLIRHKTKHAKFMIGLPIITLLQLALIYIIAKNMEFLLFF